MKVGFTAFSLFFLVPLLFFSQSPGLDSLLRTRGNAAAFRDRLELINEPATISGTPLFDYHSGIKKPYLFNGDFQLALTVGGPDFFFGRKNKWLNAFQFIPCTRVRLFQNDTSWQDKSKPVRTPSFYPRVYYFFSPEKWWNTQNKRRLYFGLGAGHHSNGQDGTEFVDFSDTVNIYNGSFSESLIAHFLVGGSFEQQARFTDRRNRQLMAKNLGRKGKRKRPKIYDVAYEKTGSLNWRLLYEYHPPYFANQKFYKTGLYGGNRLIGNLNLVRSAKLASHFREKDNWTKLPGAYSTEVFRLGLVMEYITDLSFYSGGYMHPEKIALGNISKRLNTSLTAYFPIPKTRFSALFAQLAYYGSDNYNIYFQKSFFQVRGGLAFAFFEYRETVI